MSVCLSVYIRVCACLLVCLWPCMRCTFIKKYIILSIKQKNGITVYLCTHTFTHKANICLLLAKTNCELSVFFFSGKTKSYITKHKFRYDFAVRYSNYPTSTFCLVFIPLSLYFARWFWPDLMKGRHDHTTAVRVSLRSSGALHVVQLPAGG